jgi:hypothetical protein
VNKEFHTWRDIMNRVAPPFVKDPAYKLKLKESFTDLKDMEKFAEERFN